MSDFTLRILNPGSPEAVEEGCTCSVRDNLRGRGGEFYGEEPTFIRNDFCPLHGKAVTVPQEVFIDGAFVLVWRLPLPFMEREEDREGAISDCKGCFFQKEEYDQVCCHTPCSSADRRLELFCNEKAGVVEYILVTEPPKIN